MTQLPTGLTSAVLPRLPHTPGSTGAAAGIPSWPGAAPAAAKAPGCCHGRARMGRLRVLWRRNSFGPGAVSGPPGASEAPMESGFELRFAQNPSSAQRGELGRAPQGYSPAASGWKPC